MRNLCGLTLFVLLGAGSVAAAELSTTTKAKTIPTKSTGKVGDEALKLKLAVKIGDLKSDAKQAKAGNDQSARIKQTSVKVETTPSTVIFVTTCRSNGVR